MEVWRPPAWDEICYCDTCLKAWVKYCNQIGRKDLAKVIRSEAVDFIRANAARQRAEERAAASDIEVDSFDREFIKIFSQSEIRTKGGKINLRSMTK